MSVKSLDAVLFTFALSLAVAARGVTVEQTTNDAGGKSSLTNWDASSSSPKGTPSSENDYVSEKMLRAPVDGNVIFSGKSLSIGKVGGSASPVFVPYGGTYTFDNDGLFLNRGRFQWYNSDKSSTIAGTVTVQSPASDPFGFMFGQNATTTNDQLTIMATAQSLGLRTSRSPAQSFSCGNRFCRAKRSSSYDLRKE